MKIVIENLSEGEIIPYPVLLIKGRVENLDPDSLKGMQSKDSSSNPTGLNMIICIGTVFEPSTRHIYSMRPDVGIKSNHLQNFEVDWSMVRYKNKISLPMIKNIRASVEFHYHTIPFWIFGVFLQKFWKSWKKPKRYGT